MVCVCKVCLLFDGVPDSSSESDSSEDSDIEGETASALFMAVRILDEWRECESVSDMQIPDGSPLYLV